MVQVFWECEARVTTSWARQTATTSGPFHLPSWAPDIAWAPTTTHKWYVQLIGTTSIRLIDGYRTHMRSYSARSFGTERLGDKVKAGSPIKVTYRAVGELVTA
jgi:hypothetical protein